MKTKFTLALLLSIFALNGTLGQIPTDGLVAYYPFNGNANDESGYDHNGVVNGASLTTDRFGNENHAYFFDGINDGITVPNNDLIDFSNTEDFTITLWMKTNETRMEQLINKQYPGYWNGYLVVINGDDPGYCTDPGHVLFYTASGAQEDVCSNDIINNNEWVFVTGVFDSKSNSSRLYINGVLQSDIGRRSGEIKTTQNLMIGFGTTSGNNVYYRGMIDDIRIYNRTLNNQEITALYNEKGTIPASGLVAYYPFSGNANDESGYGHNGIVSGASLTTDRFGNENCAYYFDGINNTITVPNNDLIDFGNDEDFSVAFWIKTNQQDWTTILNKQYAGYWNGYYFSINNEDGGYCTEKGHMMFYGAAGAFEDACSDTVVNTDDWVFITGVYNSNNNTIKLYVNAGLQSDMGRASGDINSLQNLQIGYGNTTEYGQIYYKGKIDDIRIYNRALSEEEIQALYLGNDFSTPSITAGSASNVSVDDIIEIPVITSQLYSSDNIISYQFNLTYDDLVLEYLACDLTGTIAEEGTVIVNNTTTGRLVVGYLNSAAIIGSGPIAILKFKVIREGYSPIQISDFLYNADAVTHITNGFVSTVLFGDVDTNGTVQAYDAALTLQYSVGLDPLPSIDPLPWETWRILTADVDGVSGITAYDASLIMQKAVGLINYFPVEDPTKSTLTVYADVELKFENGYIAFYPKGNLFGLNVFAENSNQGLREPIVTGTDVIKAFNDNDNNFAFAVASTLAPEEDKIFLKIPYTKSGSVILNMMVNNSSKSVLVNIPEIDETIIYPNPAMDVMHISIPETPATVNFYTSQGRLLRSCLLNEMNTTINIDTLPAGVYILKILVGDQIKVRHIIKQ